jgi:hypothetical protein
MPNAESVFDQTYEKYLAQLQELPLASIAPKIGAGYADGRLQIPLFDRNLRGLCRRHCRAKRQTAELRCLCHPQQIPAAFYRAARARGELGLFPGLQGFKTIAQLFRQRCGTGHRQPFCRQNRCAQNRLAKASAAIQPELPVAYDLAMQFDALPKHSVILLVNDADDEFPAQCTVLFPAHFDTCLDAECIAMVGTQLFGRLKQFDPR